MGYIGKQPASAPLTSSDIADGIITSAKISDGTIATADIANSAVTKAKTSGVVSDPFRNVIINGGFEVSQRSGTSATSFTNNNYGLDRWLNYLNGSCALNYQQLGATDSILTSLQSTSGQNFSNALYLDCTTASSLGSTDLLSILQKIEGFNHNALASKSMTLSFFVRSNRTGTFCVAFKQGSSKTYVVEYTINSANTWEQKTITITNDTLANYNTNTSVTNGSSLQVTFTLRLGTSSQQTTTGAWNSGNFYGTSNQTTWGTSTDDVFYLSGVQLELGSSASDFEFLPIDVNERRCFRYFQDMAGFVMWTTFIDGNTSTRGAGHFVFNTPMRATPSASKTNNAGTIDSQTITTKSYHVMAEANNRGTTTHVTDIELDAEL